jgi:hypothetical protein
MMADRPPSAHPLVVQFVGVLLQRTLACPTPEARRQMLYDVLADLRPWISPPDLALLRAQPFTLFDHVAWTAAGDGTDEAITVTLSPQGAAVWRAWLRQRGLDPWLSSS